jgi:hypothetical protein
MIGLRLTTVGMPVGAGDFGHGAHHRDRADGQHTVERAGGGDQGLQRSVTKPFSP